MRIFVVMKDEQPSHVTLSETEACDHFDRTIKSADFQSTSVMEVATYVHNTRVLCHIRQGA